MEQHEHGNLCPIFLKLPPENIVFLKFILESYEGLGELRTLNSHTGEVVILAIIETKNIVSCIITEFETRLGIREIPAPEYLDGDWLLGEWLKSN